MTDTTVLESTVLSADDVVRRSTLRDYVSITKVGITVANLMSTFAGLWAGSHGRPSAWLILYTLLGTALVVASGATLNNYFDRDIDRKMARTRSRALVTGTVEPRLALWMGLALGVAGLALLALLVNVTAAVFALAGLVMYAYVYTVWLKRNTTWSTVLGGFAGAMPPLVGWAAGSGGALTLPALVVFLVFFLWQPPHFFPLAMKRCEDYRAAGIPMLPVVRGFRHTKLQIIAFTVVMVPVSFLLYVVHAEGVIYLVVAATLGIVFLIKAVQGLYAKNDLVWAGKLFGYSLLYLTGLCIAMVFGAV